MRLMMTWMMVYNNTKAVTSVFDVNVFFVASCQLTKQIFSQSLIGNANSSLPFDLSIECNMYKGSKLKVGCKVY